MEYSVLGKTGLRVSRFGLGCMRFPADENEAVRLVRKAIDSGVNYLDTAYVYGDSELVTGKALRNGYRGKTILATKSPIWMISCHRDFEKYLDEQLKRLQTDVIDVYFMHDMNDGNWNSVKKHDGFSFLTRMVEKGKIRHTAFSVHNTFETHCEIVDSYDWDVSMVQLNILDAAAKGQQVGVEGLRYGAGKGLGMVVMEPLRGGNIVNKAPKAVQALLDKHKCERSLVELCFRWLYDMPETSVIISGVSTIPQLEENLRIFASSAPNVMTEAEKELISGIRTIFEARKQINCTACRYCLPCPQGIDIPGLFDFYDTDLLIGGLEWNKTLYKDLQYKERRGDSCNRCGYCVKLCPQNLDIPGYMKELHEYFVR
jgi:hypothetical protein